MKWKYVVVEERQTTVRVNFIDARVNIILFNGIMWRVVCCAL